MSDNKGMLRHFAFFEELSKMEEENPTWRAVSAGVVTMRLVDRWIEEGPRAVRDGAWEVSAVREAIAQVAETTPVRRILISIVDVMVGSTTVDMHTLCARLMAYGKALEYDAKWSLSADVYETIVLHTDPVDDADLAVAAHLQLAFSLRSLGELDAAASAYSQAASIAHAAHDLIGVLRGHLGDARIVALRGNLPRADAMLDTAIKHAAENGLDDVRSSALIDRAWVAGTGQHYDRVVCYSYEALELSKSSRQRERILNNIANAFRYLGMRDAARDAFLVISLTGQEQYMKWMAELNLMELAAEEGSELQFDKFRRDLESADFTPELRVTYLLHVGRGYHALGNAQTGISYLERAIELAAKHQMNHVIFEAEAALAAAKKDKWTARSAATEWTPEVQNVAGVIRRMATAGWGP